MKFGLLYEMETPRPWHALSEYNVYWEALAQIELADRIGIDYVWEVEHHFLEEYSHSPAPEVFYGAVTQRTKNIRIAHGVRLLPFKFNNPIKVAEQAAVLDIMSNGRVDLGTGRSTTAQELDGFGVDYDRTRDEVREALDVIVKAWTEEILEYDGKLIKIPPRRVVPKPIQKPHRQCGWRASRPIAIRWREIAGSACSASASISTSCSLRSKIIARRLPIAPIRFPKSRTKLSAR
jgi:alkanesulfonate monooxygenase SsuD/methylene tetrahydromethanopterin reductase-like flavin-dependent oxidoreductase (luciferase family)